MPDHALVESFVAAVETGDTIAALERFYSPSASMQENQQAPRAGLSLLIEHERKALSRVRSMQIRCVRPYMIAQDTVVIRWAITFETPAGKVVHLEELTYQQWANGKIEREQFFYDPAQFNA